MFLQPSEIGFLLQLKQARVPLVEFGTYAEIQSSLEFFAIWIRYPLSHLRPRDVSRTCQKLRMWELIYEVNRVSNQTHLQHPIPVREAHWPELLSE